jgi:uncharacterized repeat protein (TIGR03803 family)
MQRKKVFDGFSVVAIFALGFALITGTLAIAQEKVLYNLGGDVKNGTLPFSNLIFDSIGNLYGTTLDGGPYARGTVFELLPSADGGWSERVLHTFNDGGKDGSYSYASLIFDGSGNLYGTTWGAALMPSVQCSS